MNRLYPLLLTPHLVEALWGGDALVSRYGKAGSATATYGESWECWSDNKVANGTEAGKSIGELLHSMGPALIGLTRLTDRKDFPVLTKIIDAHQPLSVQVHPDDVYARRVEQAPNGKTECWVILEALPGAELILGFAQDCDAEQYRRRLQAGSLSEILRRVPVKKGDVFYIPAGTLHSIGAGIVLFETQQTSTTTYRIYDWDRVDANGQKRVLQVDKAADVLDFRASSRGPVQPFNYRYLGANRRLLVIDDHFGLEQLEVPGHVKFLTEAAATVIQAHDEAILLRTIHDEVPLLPWQCALIPAGLDRVEIRAEQPTSVFTVTPAGAATRARKRLTALGIDTAPFDAFLAQFV